MKKKQKQLTPAQKAARKMRARLFKTARESSGTSVSEASVETKTTRDTVRAMESVNHDPRESTLVEFVDYYATKDKSVKHLSNVLARVGGGNGRRVAQGRG
jgi:hypothetical protein